MLQDLFAFLGFQIVAGADRAACQNHRTRFIRAGSRRDSEGINEPIIPQGIGLEKGLAQSEARDEQDLGQNG